ncbi:MAG: ABC transporter ATP-binding protein [Candidatus Thiodiazotropha sp. (ex Monitilora ramsayi)]|nr:ABC transporter ATP-binding protein [Candidatus Thiodiazotropha sp. (ex Monitilora ramsayi)]
MKDDILLTVRSVKKRFGRREVLREIELDLKSGHCLQLGGPNGAGKTTLLRILSGLERPDQGLIDCGDGRIAWKRIRRRLLEQTLYLHQQPYMFDGTVRYNLAYALPNRLSANEREERIKQAMDWAGLEPIRNTSAKELSGGERQRVSLARAWLRQPRMLMLDEPTANLDRESRRRTLNLLTSLKETGMSLVLASHDPLHLSTLIDRCLLLHEGRLVETEPFKIMPLSPSHLPSPMRFTA